MIKVLFIITNSELGTWLSEVTHPYWHLAEAGIEVDFSSPNGGRITWVPRSDPRTPESQEANDLVSKGFLSDSSLTQRLDTTDPLATVDIDQYAAVHVAGGRGATFDLFPNAQVGRVLEYFWSRGRTVGAICHGAISLANNPDRIRGRNVTGFSWVEDRELEAQFGPNFIIPHYPPRALEAAGAHYSCSEPHGVRVVVNGKLVTGQNQQSASEYGLTLLHMIRGYIPVFVHNDPG